MKHEPGVESEVMTVLERWSDALRKKDLDALSMCYTDDVRVFDIGSQLTGYDKLQTLWESRFPYFPNPIECERRDIRVDGGSDFAVVSLLSRMIGMESDHPSACSRFRTTMCLRKQDDA